MLENSTTHEMLVEMLDDSLFTWESFHDIESLIESCATEMTPLENADLLERVNRRQYAILWTIREN